MVAIQGYNQRIVRQAQVADTVNPQAIAEKAAGWNAAAQVAGAGADIYARIEEADDVATINEMVITREREKIDFIEQSKKQYEGAPAGFSTYVEKEMQKRDAKAVAALPARLQTAYKTTTAKSNLNDYEQNLGWETQRKIAVVGDKIGRAGKEISNISYTFGAQGKSFDEIVPQIDATMVAGSGVLSPEKLGKFDDDLRADAAKQYLAGVIARDPKEAQDLLNSGKFAKYLTTEDSLKMSKTIWDSTPDLMKLDQIKQSRTGSAEGMALDTILRNEGGFVESDGASGQPAIYGINRGAHKQAYDEAERITREKGQAAGQEYARQFYKKEYFDKYNIGELPSEVQTIVADGMVNHWSGFRTKLLDAAKNGATPDELIEMRRNEYLRLAEADKKYEPSLRGWLNRLDGLPRGVNTFDALTPSEKIKELRNVPEYEKAYQAQAVIAGLALADPNNKAHRDAINSEFVTSGLKDALASQSPEAVAPVLSFINKYSVVPDEAQRLMRGAMNNGTPEQKQFAYGLIGEVAKVNPSSLTGKGGFAEQDLKDAGAFNSLIRSGADARFAAKAIEESRNPLSQDIRIIREEKINEKIAEMSDSKIISSFDDALPFNAPDFANNAQRDLLLADYRRIYKESYLQYGDEDQAKEAAEIAIKVTSGVSLVGGKKLMKYPPEKYYSVDGVDVNDTADEFTKQIKYDLKTAGYDTEDFTISPTIYAETKVNNGMKPAYNIWVKDSNGRLELALDEKNIPIAVQFDQAPLLELKAKRELEYKRQTGTSLGNEQAIRRSEETQPVDINAMGLGE